MQVIKRDNSKEPVSFDKIHQRILTLCALPDTLARLDPNSFKVRIISQLKPLRKINPITVTKKIIKGLHNDVKTCELDVYGSKVAQGMCLIHPEHGNLAARLLVSNHQKNIIYNLAYHFNVPHEEIERRPYYYTTLALYGNKDNENKRNPLVAPYIAAIVEMHYERLEKIINPARDYNHNYVGFQVLQTSYLQQALVNTPEGPQRITVERPGHLFMRVALGIWCAKEFQNPEEQYLRHLYDEMMANGASFDKLTLLVSKFQNTQAPRNNIDFDDALKDALGGALQPNFLTEEMWKEIKDTYDMMSDGFAIHATPTLFNIGTRIPQGSSCYGHGNPDDSIEGMAYIQRSSMKISKVAGGIGTPLTSIRPQGDYIRGTNGKSNGLVPYLRVLDAISVLVDQGGGKRPGSNAIYTESWHADKQSILSAKNEVGNELERARNLFYAEWLNDEFIRSVIFNKPWYLMSSDACAELMHLYDEGFSTEWVTDEKIAAEPEKWQFTARYRELVRAGKYKEEIKAQEIWERIIESIIQNGVPYMTSKDAHNRKNNQKHYGRIYSSNLCTEISEHASATETFVCNLSSICLPKFWNSTTRKFDWKKFRTVVHQCVRNLNRIIDINFYPTLETKRSNMLHRPIGLGVQGLADLYTLIGVSFDSDVAAEWNAWIFERLYYEALWASSELAARDGPYETYGGSPVSQGILQQDMWEAEGQTRVIPELCDWASLRAKIAKHGLRNSLLVAPMPTASTSYIMGNSSAFEPHNSIIWKRKSKEGEFIMINAQLVADLENINLWTPEMKDKILLSDGSVWNIQEIPSDIRRKYKTVWDMSPKVIINQAVDRGFYIDQSQSMNLYISHPTIKLLGQVLMYAWRRGLKTLSYYIHGRAPINAQKTQVTGGSSQMLRNLSKTSSVLDGEVLDGEVLGGEVLGGEVLGEAFGEVTRGGDCHSCGS